MFCGGGCPPATPPPTLASLGRREEFRRPGKNSKKFSELFRSKASLLDDRFQSSALQLPIVMGEGYPESRIVGMLENIVRPCAVMKKKTSAFKRPENFPELERGEALTHAESKPTVMYSLTGSVGISLSLGIGSPSLRRLSR